MRTIYGDLDIDVVQCFDAEVWLQDRNLINFKHGSTDAVEYVELYAKRSSATSYESVTKYHLDENKEVVIDVTDWLRTYQDTTDFRTYCKHEDGTVELVEIPLSVAGLINPSDFIIPTQSKGISSWLILPPSMMLQDLGGGLSVEIRGAAAKDKIILSPSGDIAIAASGSNAIATATTSFEVETESNESATYTLRPLLCGTRYASVEWVSASGATKRHTWCVKGAISSTGDTISLETKDGSFNTIKGRQDGFSLFLDGLTAYDMWYYSDICTSSCVKVSLDGTNWRQVEVGTDGITIPDGDAEFNKIEVKVTYKQYDAFTM